MSDVQLARLETEMKNVTSELKSHKEDLKETLNKQQFRLDQLAECYQESTVLLAQTCTLLQEFKSVKQEQNVAAVERAKLEKDVSYLKKACTACVLATAGMIGNASGVVTGEQIKALIKIFGA